MTPAAVHPHRASGEKPAPKVRKPKDWRALLITAAVGLLPSGGVAGVFMRNSEARLTAAEQQLVELRVQMAALRTDVAWLVRDRGGNPSAPLPPVPPSPAVSTPAPP